MQNKCMVDIFENHYIYTYIILTISIQSSDVKVGTLRTSREVQCPFSNGEQDNGGIRALTQLHVSISNDAQHNSDSVLFTQYDSHCMTCSVVGDQHACQQKVRFLGFVYFQLKKILLVLAEFNVSFVDSDIILFVDRRYKLPLS